MLIEKQSIKNVQCVESRNPDVTFQQNSDQERLHLRHNEERTQNDALTIIRQFVRNLANQLMSMIRE